MDRSADSWICGDRDDTRRPVGGDIEMEGGLKKRISYRVTMYSAFDLLFNLLGFFKNEMSCFFFVHSYLMGLIL